MCTIFTGYNFLHKSWLNCFRFSFNCKDGTVRTRKKKFRKFTYSRIRAFEWEVYIFRMNFYTTMSFTLILKNTQSHNLLFNGTKPYNE